MKKYKTLSYWLPKIPFLSLLLAFGFPLILMGINYYIGLFFIAFYISYWTVRIFQGYYYILKTYLRLLKVENIDFSKNKLLQKEGRTIKHIVIIPIYTEPLDVIEENVEALIKNKYPYKGNITILLAVEERAPHAKEYAAYIVEKYKKNLVHVVSVIHPDNLAGEGKVKGANISYAIEEYEKKVDLDPKKTFITTIDTDTRVEKRFFSIITTTFLSTDYRDHAIYQYTPIYSNNWRDGAFFARLIATGTTLWQLVESQDPEFYRNFAVYGQSLECLKNANYWSRTSIVEDGLQYWRAYFAWNGNFRIVHTPAICHMDLVDESNLYRTIRSQHKQLRRWSWGCTDIEYVIPKFLRASNIPLGEKIRKTTYLIQNHLFWAGGPLILFFIGYVPGMVYTIDHSLAIFTVPIAISIIFTILFATVIFPSILSIHIMRRYMKFYWYDYIINFFQWVTVPLLTLTLFSFPAIESQIRLFFGKRIDVFDTTQKMSRKTHNKTHP